MSVTVWAARRAVATSGVGLVAVLAVWGGVAYSVVNAAVIYLQTNPAMASSAWAVSVGLLIVGIAASVATERAVFSRNWFAVVVFGAATLVIMAISGTTVGHGKSSTLSADASAQVAGDTVYAETIAAAKAAGGRADAAQKQAAGINAALAVAEVEYSNRLSSCAGKFKTNCEFQENKNWSKNAGERAAKLQQAGALQSTSKADAETQTRLLGEATLRKSELEKVSATAGALGAFDLLLAMLPDALLPCLQFVFFHLARVNSLNRGTLNRARTVTEQATTATVQRQDNLTASNDMRRQDRATVISEAIRQGRMPTDDYGFISLSQTASQYRLSRHHVRKIFSNLSESGVLLFENKRYRYADGKQRKPNVTFITYREDRA